MSHEENEPERTLAAWESRYCELSKIFCAGIFLEILQDFASGSITYEFAVESLGECYSNAKQYFVILEGAFNEFIKKQIGSAGGREYPLEGLLLGSVSGSLKKFEETELQKVDEVYERVGKSLYELLQFRKEPEKKVKVKEVGEILSSSCASDNPQKEMITDRKSYVAELFYRFLYLNSSEAGNSNRTAYPI